MTSQKEERMQKEKIKTLLNCFFVSLFILFLLRVFTEFSSEGIVIITLVSYALLILGEILMGGGKQ